MGKLFDNTTRPDPENETRAFGSAYTLGREIPLKNVGQKRTEYVASNPEVKTPLIMEPEDDIACDMKDTTDEERIHVLRTVLFQAVIWNEDYKHINNLGGGDPYWVSMAYEALSISRK